MSRTLVKTLTYSLMHLTVAVSVAYALTGNWYIALGIGLIEPVVQTFAYSMHERMWERFMPTRSRQRPDQTESNLLAEPA